MTAQELINKLQTLIENGAIKPTGTVMSAMYDEKQDENCYSYIDTLAWDNGCDTNLFVCNHDYILHSDDTEIDFNRKDFGIYE